MPHRADGMDHMRGRQSEAGRNPGIAGGAAAERAARRQQPGAGRAMDRPIDAAAT
jgi:hypothetical protein